MKNFNISELLKIEAGQIKSLLEKLDSMGILSEALPELTDLKGVDTTKESFHKDNFIHTLKVVENTYYATTNPYLRLVAFLHDIGKAQTKEWDDEKGWGFHDHEKVSGKMLGRIFRRLDIPQEHYAYVKNIVVNHGMPKELYKTKVTESALRRFGNLMGKDLEDLVLFCKCDITTTNPKRRADNEKEIESVYQEILKIRKLDKEKEWRCVITGEIIMEHFGIKGEPVGIIKKKIEKAIKDGLIKNEIGEAMEYMKTLEV